MNKKIIDVTLSEDGKLLIDLGGALDRGCCGCPANIINDKLAALGVKTKIQGIHCRIPVVDRVKAKLAGLCKDSPLDKDNELEKKRRM